MTAPERVRRKLPERVRPKLPERGRPKVPERVSLKAPETVTTAARRITRRQAKPEAYRLSTLDNGLRVATERLEGVRSVACLLYTSDAADE